MTCALLTAVPASAQIYTWHDANGHMVISDRPKDGMPRVFSVPKAADAVRATRFVAPEKSALYDPLIREHAENCRRPDGPRAGRGPGGVRLQRLRAVAERRARPDAAHAGDDSAIRRAEPLQPDGEHPRRRVVSAPAARSLLEQRSARARRLQRRTRRRRRHGVAIPPYKETRDYVSKINRMAGQSRPRCPARTSTRRRKSSTAAKSPAIRTTSRQTAATRSSNDNPVIE